MSAAADQGGPTGTVLEKGQKQAGLTLDEAKERAQWLADRVRGRRTG